MDAARSGKKSSHKKPTGMLARRLPSPQFAKLSSRARLIPPTAPMPITPSADEGGTIPFSYGKPLSAPMPPLPSPRAGGLGELLAHADALCEEETAHYRIDPADLTLGEAIGAGAFGEVSVGRYHHTPVAVKVLFRDACEEDRALFEKEVRLMARLHHPNIVQFIGFAHVPELALVLELVAEGSIASFVPERRPGLRAALSFCLDMARAVEYLHTRRPLMVIHRDIKPPNFLVTKCLRVKLGDFGIARNLRGAPFGRARAADADGSARRGGWGRGDTQEVPSPTTVSPGGPLHHFPGGDSFADAPSDDGDLTTDCGTVRFMAPEVASPRTTDRSLSPPRSTSASYCRADYTHAADTFSLALVFYFVWERKLPCVDGARDALAHMTAIYDGKRPLFSRTPAVIRALISEMWAFRPRERPTASAVCGRLERMRVKSSLTTTKIVLDS